MYQHFNICLSVQRGLIPGITQIAAQVIKTDARFSCFVLPKVPISVNAEQVTRTSWDGELMTVHGKPVETASISEALSTFMNFLKNLGNVVFTCVAEGESRSRSAVTPSVCPSVRPSVRPSVCPSVCPSVLPKILSSQLL